MFSLSPNAFTLCFSHVNAIFQSVFLFTSFFIGLRGICLRAQVLNLVFIICSLLVRIDCVSDKLKATFSSMKKTLLRPQILSPER